MDSLRKRTKLFRCLVIGQYEFTLVTRLAQAGYNIIISPTDSTGISPCEVLYGVALRLFLSTFHAHNDFVKEHLNMRTAVQNAMELGEYYPTLHVHPRTARKQYEDQVGCWPFLS